MSKRSKNNGGPFLSRRAAKIVLTGTVGLALALPGGIAAAADVAVQQLQIAAGEGISANAAAAPDASKAKVTSEQAVATLKALFPTLKDANVSGTRLTNSDGSYPQNNNQLVWDIQWNVQVGSSSFGFSSRVDAISGDVLSVYLSSPLNTEGGYYPPKLTRDEALAKAKAFIAKAAPSLKGSELKEQNSTYARATSVLFGPVQYNFIFQVSKNGLPAATESVYITLDGNGEVSQFSKSYSGLEYPSAKPAISLAAAEKTYNDRFKVGLYYAPVYNNNTVDHWVLSWQPQASVQYLVDAQTGKLIDYEGREATSVTYEKVPSTKERFTPRPSGKELTAEEAAKLLQQVFTIPAGRKLLNQTLGGQADQGSKTWQLAWQAEDSFISGAPSRTYAEIDASTGEIKQIQLEQYMTAENKPVLPAPAGGKKLTQAEAKQKAIALINRLYNKAADSLLLAEHGGTWSVLSGGQGYRYEFVRQYQGIPVLDGSIALTIDSYGRVKTYTNYSLGSLDALKDKPAPAISEAAAKQSYLDKYKLTLEYISLGGYYTSGEYVQPQIKLAYSPHPSDGQEAVLTQVLDAATGKWVSLYTGYANPADSSPPAVDIKGHPQEQQFNELLNYGVFSTDKDGKINPEQEITLGDWYSYLVKAATPYYSAAGAGTANQQPVAGVKPDSSYYNVISFALEYGWIAKDAVVKPEEKLTREGLAVQLAAFLKYSKISALLANDPVVAGFSDNASISNKGAVALAVKLGLLQADNGKFNPQQTVTKALAADVLMKLVQLQGKTDQSFTPNRY